MMCTSQPNSPYAVELPSLCARSSESNLYFAPKPMDHMRCTSKFNAGSTPSVTSHASSDLDNKSKDHATDTTPPKNRLNLKLNLATTAFSYSSRSIQADSVTTSASQASSSHIKHPSMPDPTVDSEPLFRLSPSPTLRAASSTSCFFDPSTKDETICARSSLLQDPSIALPSTIQSGGFKVNTPTMPDFVMKPLCYDTIKREQMKRVTPIPRVDFREQICSLGPSVISFFNAHEALLFQKTPSLILDIRPFADFVKSHVEGAVNVCLPSTLLKRPNFTLLRCINSISRFERQRIQDFLAAPASVMFIYDNFSSSANVFHMCSKFITSDLFHGKEHKIYLLDCSFDDMAAANPSFIETSAGAQPQTTSSSVHGPSSEIEGPIKSPTTKLVTPPGAPNLNNILPPLLVNKAHSLAEISSARSSDEPAPPSSNTPTSKVPVLSKFSLPQVAMAPPVFKIRHNEELGNFDVNPFERTVQTLQPSSVLNENTSSMFRLRELPRDISTLPRWLSSTICLPNYDPASTDLPRQSTKISDDFHTLERFEQRRLVKALSYKGSRGTYPPISGEVTPTISAGIELGHKNRYKDIFLYEHSRVRLHSHHHDGNIKPLYHDDYINASYINPVGSLNELTHLSPLQISQLQYIATQGPLEQTVGDFWKCVVNANTPLILSLTDEVENGLIKCAPFWKGGIYHSGSDSMHVKLLRSQQVRKHLMIRVFQVTMTTDTGLAITKVVLQAQLLSWPDMGTLLRSEDLIQLIQLKRFLADLLTASTPNQISAVVHCSAGCGRTGTLIAIDTIISVLRNNYPNSELPYNPIYAIVNNLRQQRISMVQNLGQYYMIHEVILNYLKGTSNLQCGYTPGAESQWLDLTKLDIVKDFAGKFAHQQQSSLLCLDSSTI